MCRLPTLFVSHGAPTFALQPGLYPKADVPVLQVSMPLSLDAESAWGFGEALAPLADEGPFLGMSS